MFMLLFTFSELGMSDSGATMQIRVRGNFSNPPIEKRSPVVIDVCSMISTICAPKKKLDGAPSNLSLLYSVISTFSSVAVVKSTQYIND
jgi:hypothetical protein